MNARDERTTKQKIDDLRDDIDMAEDDLAEEGFTVADIDALRNQLAELTESATDTRAGCGA